MTQGRAADDPRDQAAGQPETPFRLDGRTALITGAGTETGIGQAIARAFAAAGARVALGDVDAAGAEANARAISGRTYAVTVDVTQPESVASAVRRVEQQFGPIDILVNNAGITRATPLWETSLAEFDLVQGINVRGGWICLQAVLPSMMQRRWGRILWLSSIAGKQGGGIFGSAHYAASKAAVIGLCQAAARQLGPYGITSNAIAPGYIHSGIIQRGGGSADLEAQLRQAAEQNTPMRRAGRPLDIAHAALFLASEEAGYVTGEILDVNGGAYFD